MARSTFGLVKTNPDALAAHLRRAVAYTTTQTTGTVMRTMPNNKPRRDPAGASRPQAHPATCYATTEIDTAYLAANPYIP